MTDLNSIHNLTDLVQKGIISQSTVERVKIAKIFIENKYKFLEKNTIDFQKKWENIEKYFSKNTKKKSDLSKEKKIINEKKNEILRLTRKKLSIEDFEILKLVGKGGFGEVNLCKYKETNKIYAIKIISLDKLNYRNGLFQIHIEKLILSWEKNNEWITQLRYSFIENNFLYLVMDYCPGGDLMNFLIYKDTLTEDEAKFYIAEIILCVESVHKNNCIHRDLKPDNILIDIDGHLKLSDFGLSILSDSVLYPFSSQKFSFPETKKYLEDNESIENRETNFTLNCNIKNNSNKKLLANSNVGSVDYVAPEVIGKNYYGKEIDWWSVGAILYEMLVGYPPFFSDTMKITCEKIKKHEQYLQFPKEKKLSSEVKNLIKSFLSSAEYRISDIDEIKNHIFFEGFDWEKIKEMKPPFIPKISSIVDTKYFKYENYSSNRFVYKKRKNLYFNNRDDCSFTNKIYFRVSNFYFKYNRDIEELKNNSEIQIIKIIKTEIEKLDKVESEKSSSSVSGVSSTCINNEQINPFSSKTLQNIKRFSDFSPQISMNISYQSTKYKKKKLRILPIRNIINNQKTEKKWSDFSPSPKKARKNLHLSNSSIKFFSEKKNCWSPKINNCFKGIKTEYEKEGITIENSTKDFNNVFINPKKKKSKRLFIIRRTKK